MKKWIVTYVDITIGKPRVLAVCNTKEDARKEFLADWETFIHSLKENGIEEDEIVMDVDKMSICMPCNDIGCDWNIEEVEIPISTEGISKAEEILVDNGIEEDEADTVLQAVGYALLDTELYSEDKDDDDNF